MQLTQRDRELLLFMQANNGRTFLPVLEKTLFDSVGAAKARVHILVNANVLRLVKTGLTKPRNMIVFGEEVNVWFLQEYGELAKKSKIARTTMGHEIIQQIASYWLGKLGTIERITPYHAKYLKHLPDLILNHKQQGRIFIEIELTKKSNKRYTEIISLMAASEPASILYILESHQKTQDFLKSLPQSKLLLFISIDNLVSNIKESGKIGAYKKPTTGELL